MTHTGVIVVLPFVYHLGSYDLLDPTNEMDLYALYYVYLPRIDNALIGFEPSHTI